MAVHPYSCYTSVANWQLHLWLREHEGGNDGESNKREKSWTFLSSKHINNEEVINEPAVMDSLKSFVGIWKKVT